MHNTIKQYITHTTDTGVGHSVCKFRYHLKVCDIEVPNKTEKPYTIWNCTLKMLE